MKKYAVRLLTALAAISLVIIAASVIGSRLDKQNAALTTAAGIIPTVYTLSDYNGRLAIYRNEEPEPIEVFEVFSSSLPQEEYRRVLIGVSAASEAELQRLIEAYTS